MCRLRSVRRISGASVTPDTEYAEQSGAAHLLERFKRWDKDISAHWGGWYSEARENYDLTAGRQWEKNAEEAAEELELTTVVLNQIDVAVSAVCGSEMTNRQEVRYFPREMSTVGPDGRRQDAVVNEIYTSAAEWVRDETDAADEESEAFRDVLICGLGWIETRMDYEADPDGMASISRVDPLEMAFDPSARRPNAADRRYQRRIRAFSKEDVKRIFGHDPDGMGEKPSYLSSVHENNPGSAYDGRGGFGLDEKRNDECWVAEYQWYDLERVHQVQNPKTGELEELEAEEFARLAEAMPELEGSSVSILVRRYYRAFRVGDEVLEATRLPDDEFTQKPITGKLDRNMGHWYGMVRAMRDPQRLLNKQVSQIQRIIDTNAKGGVDAETDAFEDPEQAQEDIAASNTIVWYRPGGLQKTRPRQISSYPSGIDRLLMIASETITGVTGVNAEMLGKIDREQAGVVDVTRKEAAYGVLKSFFNALRKYRKEHGRHLLKLITKYMTDERLIRVMGRNGNIQYLPLARQDDTMRYDVIVDEAPTGPAQKEKVFQFMTAMMPLLRSMNPPPQVLLKLLEFSPLPSTLVQELQQTISEIPPQPSAEQQKLQAEAQKSQMEMRLKAQQAQSDAKLEEMRLNMKAQSDAQANAMKAAVEQERAAQTARLEIWKAEQAMALKERQFEFEKRMSEQQQAFEMQLAQLQAVMGAGKANGASQPVRMGGEPG